MKDLAYYDVSSLGYKHLREKRAAEFRKDLGEKYNVTRQLIDFVWDQSHSDGLQAVIDTLDELMEIIKAELEN